MEKSVLSKEGKMKIKTHIKMIRNAVFGDGSMENFTEKEKVEITKWLEKKEPKLEKYAKKLEDKTYKLSKKKWFQTIWKAHHNIKDLNNFIEEYEREHNVN